MCSPRAVKVIRCHWPGVRNHPEPIETQAIGLERTRIVSIANVNGKSMSRAELFFGLGLKIMGPANMHLTGFKIHLPPSQKISLLAPKARPKAKAQSQVLLRPRLPQVMLRAREKPDRIDSRGVPPGSRIFEPDALKRIGGQLHFEHGDHIGRK